MTRWVQDRANELLRENNAGVKRLPFAKAIRAPTTREEDFVLPYVNDLRNVVDMDAIRTAGLKLGVDPLGGAALPYWEPINSVYKLDIKVVNPKLDPSFSFMTVDHDGKIRMDCSSPYAMARLVALKDEYRVAFANDPDADRHGIVTPGAGLMNPNHFMAVAIRYLLTHRPRWPAKSAVGKTLVSSGMIDRVVHKLARPLCEVPVGFIWFAPGLFDCSFCYGGEASAGASFLRFDGTVWTTDKDGPIMDLLAAEITARTGKDPGAHFAELAAEFGMPYYTRIDAAATPAQKATLQKLSPDAVKESQLAGDAITARLTRAPGNNAPIGGLKVATASGWFAARPSGTGKHLQDLCRKLPRRETFANHRGGGAADREQRAGRRGKTLSKITKLMQKTVKSPTQCKAWKALAAHHKQARKLHLRKLFADDPKRGERLTAGAAGLHLDYSKNRVTDRTLKLLLQLAKECGLRARIDAMFSGEKINLTENRAVLHTALRAPRGASILVDGKNVVPEVHAVLDRMADFTSRVRNGSLERAHRQTHQKRRQHRHRRLRPGPGHGP